MPVSGPAGVLLDGCLRVVDGLRGRSRTCSIAARGIIGCSSDVCVGGGFYTHVNLEGFETSHLYFRFLYLVLGQAGFAIGCSIWLFVGRLAALSGHYRVFGGDYPGTIRGLSVFWGGFWGTIRVLSVFRGGGGGDYPCTIGFPPENTQNL